tara:strand:- start:238 stop:516 length:279 start_codon:yes stop_codon:yes gene_type:complete
MDKKIYQKLQRYEDDKRYLYNLFIKDQLNLSKEDYVPQLDFQSDDAQTLFEKSVPDSIKRECREKLKPDEMMQDHEENSFDSNQSTSFDAKL